MRAEISVVTGYLLQFFFNLFFFLQIYLVCVYECLAVHMSVHCMEVWHLQKLEDSSRSSGTGATDDC